MTKPWLLDTGPLGRLAHPAPNADLVVWIERQIEAGILIIIPEISDYELRRNLLLEGLSRSVKRLDELATVCTYLPLTAAMMKDAAALWADARRAGKPTAHEHALDGDVILAAQARAIGGRIVTENVGHLRLSVQAVDWRTGRQTNS